MDLVSNPSPATATVSTRGPRVSVGLPVYNGERYVAAALAGLLNQTFTDIEVIVSDNASTDRTPTILREALRHDARIRIHRFDANQGPAANYNKVAELARGEYFMWAAADDLHAPRFIENAVTQLDADPTTVVAYAGTSIIDESGQVVRDYAYQPDLDAADPADRLQTLLNVRHRLHGAFEIFGLMRGTALRSALPQGPYARADSVFLVRMALRGRFVRHPDRLFFNRDHGERSVRSQPTRSFHGKGLLAQALGAGPIPADEWWDASRRNRAVWPEWRLLAEYRRAARDAPLTDAQRSACNIVLRDYALRHVPKLGRDVALNTELALRHTARLLSRQNVHTIRSHPTRAPTTATTQTLITVADLEQDANL